MSLYRSGNRYLSSEDPYLKDIQPILAKRCMGCHSCTNGPCQLNFTSYEGVARGLMNVEPNKSVTLGSTDTRLSNNWPLETWRKIGFTSILPEPDRGIPPQDSLLYLSLTLGRDKNPNLSLSEAMDLGQKNMQQDYQCPTDKQQLLKLVSKHKLSGMPWGLSGVPDDEMQTLINWVEQGARGPSASAQKFLQTPVNVPLVQQWENFFNRDDLRNQLVGRYIFEHTFLAHIQLDENPGEFFQIVRSRTAFPAAIEKITTPLPSDHPGTDNRIYYRLEKIGRVIEAKTHTVWHLNLEKLAYFDKLFMLDKAWPQPLLKLPGYASTNPFVYFEAIPVLARARFMMQESFVINQSIARGPICFDQAAANGVDEYFWKWFIAPESDPTVLEPMLGLDSYSDFYPTYKEQAIIRDDFAERRYRWAFEKTLRRLKPQGLSVNDIWTGTNWQPDARRVEEKNPNAWLAIYRHQFTAEVFTGKSQELQGFPRSVQLISYAAHERIYYNEAARFRYWGSSLHKLDTWNWVMYTRTESEDLFASLFSNNDYRQSLRNRMTDPLFRIFIGLEDYAKDRPMLANDNETEYSLGQLLHERMGESVRGPTDHLNNWPLTDLAKGIPSEIDRLDQWEQGLRTLTGEQGLNAEHFAQFVPNLIHIRIGNQYLYSLSVNRGYIYRKRSEPGVEKASRRPAADRLHAIKGFMGVTPYLYLDLAWTDAAAFLRDLAAVKSVEDFERIKAQPYAIRRNDPKIWEFTEWLNQKQIEQDPAEAGLLDLRYYDAEEKPF